MEEDPNGKREVEYSPKFIVVSGLLIAVGLFVVSVVSLFVASPMNFFGEQASPHEELVYSLVNIFLVCMAAWAILSIAFAFMLSHRPRYFLYSQLMMLIIMMVVTTGLVAYSNSQKGNFKSQYREDILKAAKIADASMPSKEPVIKPSRVIQIAEDMGLKLYYDEEEADPSFESSLPMSILLDEGTSSAQIAKSHDDYISLAQRNELAKEIAGRESATPYTSSEGRDSYEAKKQQLEVIDKFLANDDGSGLLHEECDEDKDGAYRRGEYIVDNVRLSYDSSPPTCKSRDDLALKMKELFKRLDAENKDTPRRAG
jgi:hypothetical protein